MFHAIKDFEIRSFQATFSGGLNSCYLKFVIKYHVSKGIFYLTLVACDVGSNLDLFTQAFCIDLCYLNWSLVNLLKDLVFTSISCSEISYHRIIRLLL